jgi:uncharacterized protein
MWLYIDELKRRKGDHQLYTWEKSAKELGLEGKELPDEVKIKVDLKVTFAKEIIYIEGKAAVKLDLQCVRCLQNFNCVLDLEFKESFPLSREGQTDSEHLIIEHGFVDLTPYFRELVLLNLPLKALCQENCRGICPLCGRNLNFEECNCTYDNVDPRLAVLKKFKKEV